MRNPHPLGVRYLTVRLQISNALTIVNITFLRVNNEDTHSDITHSFYMKHLDAQLNSTTRLITETVMATPTTWLPVLNNIVPPDSVRKELL